MVPVVPDQGGQGRRSQQRGVAGQDDHVALPVVCGEAALVGQAGQAHRRGVAGAALVGLFDELDVHVGWGMVHQGLGDPLPPVADHYHHPVDGQLGQRVEDVEDEGAAAQLVQRLGPLRPHAGPLTGG